MPKQARAVRTRHKLVTSAAESFVRHGYEKVVLADVASRAGVSGGGLSFHFGGKRALAEAVLEAASERLGRITAEGAARNTGSVLDAVAGTMRRLLAELEADPVLRAGFNLSRDVRGLGGAQNPDVRWQRWVEGMLVRAERDGSLAADVPARGLSYVLTAATADLGMRCCAGSEAAPDALDRLWSLLLPRVSTPAPGAVR